MPEFVSTPRGKSATRIRDDVRVPRKYKVLMHNDNYTTMDFVVSVLQSVFRMTKMQAVGVMLSIHKSGFGVCGVFPLEIAESKIEEAHAQAREEEFPLRCTMEPE